MDKILQLHPGLFPLPDPLGRDSPNRVVIMDDPNMPPAKFLTDLNKEGAHLCEGSKNSGESRVSL